MRSSMRSKSIVTGGGSFGASFPAFADLSLFLSLSLLSLSLSFSLSLSSSLSFAVS
jgi:hypothetical protein